MNLVIIISSGEVHYFCCLVLNRLYHTRMAMPYIQYCDTSSEVDIGISIDIFNDDPLGALYRDRGGLCGCCKIFLVGFNYFNGLGARRIDDDVWHFFHYKTPYGKNADVAQNI